MRTRERFGEFYNREDTVENYDRIRLRYFHRKVHRKLERFTSTLYLKRNSNILEVGCGTGFITQDLIKYGKVTCLDPSKQMIEIARLRVEDKARFERKSIFDLDFRNKFDYAVSYRVLNHFEDEDIVNSLKKMKNAVKKNGLVIFTLENKSFLRSIIQLIMWRRKAPSYKHSHQDINKIVEKAGLRIKDILAMQHTWLMLPLHSIGEVIRSKRFEDFVFNLESMLFHLKFCNNDWVVICQKSYS